jgi:hypothetical protein
VGTDDLSLIPIASAKDGVSGTFSGRVCLASERTLVARLSERPCVYWEINQTLGRGDPESSEGLPFWLEDDTGRILVQPQSVEVAARAEGRTRAVAVVDANINQVSQRIRQIKDERRMAAGPAAKKLLEEHRHLKRLATLLCAIRAHARGNVHIGRTLKGQDAAIRKRSPEFEGEAISLVGERFEVVLSEDAELEVSGLCVMAMAPPGMGHTRGYRDSPTCLQLRAPVGGRLHIRGLGDAAPFSKESGAESGAESGDAPSKARPGFLRRLVRYFAP